MTSLDHSRAGEGREPGAHTPEQQARHSRHFGPSTHSMRKGNHHCEVTTSAIWLRVQAKPIPNAAEYQAWCDGHYSSDARGRGRWDGRKLRRAVVMRRNGCTNREIGDAVGLHADGVCTTLRALPEELRP